MTAQRRSCIAPGECPPPRRRLDGEPNRGKSEALRPLFSKVPTYLAWYWDRGGVFEPVRLHQVEVHFEQVEDVGHQVLVRVGEEFLAGDH
ncbi:MAG: hypothetical protein QNL12_07400 [Acidimicrobiia bacterium]|nr:hypothetical protein [Acidimicrobiia bacterium]MDX2467121.1 hypothetical protein [Acidimicrobiia bacterium]